jgi:hypothetical protein
MAGRDAPWPPPRASGIPAGLAVGARATHPCAAAPRAGRPLNAVRALFAGRPAWMSALMLFCAYMAFVYVPWDLLLKPVAQDQEVWFGYRFKGWWATATAPLHLAVYAAGAWGFLRMRPWMWPWAAAYCAQVAFSMAVFAAVHVLPARGALVALASGGISTGVFAVLAIALWRARDRFTTPPGGG